MTDTNNFMEITQNFDTIKTLLNSIRAQGILNTSDVDKILTGINSKLEKLNTEEDIDLIKIFLSELKQNLEDRHNILISKFGAIESLFSNLLKNSSEVMKSTEAKNLFDIVATNLSVFSREIVAQKETLNDAINKIDIMRSDDSNKKEIIKNINSLKNDLERLNNGFDSTIVNINENFKTLTKALEGLDNTDIFNNFRKEIADLVNSSSGMLSMLQMIDKKSNDTEELIKALTTKEDSNTIKKLLSNIEEQNKVLREIIENYNLKFNKIDNLAEKIDASVNIIAGLKVIIKDNVDNASKELITKLDFLEAEINNVNNIQKFEDFRNEISVVINNILATTADIQTSFIKNADVFKDLYENIRNLNIETKFNILEKNIHEQISINYDNLYEIIDVNTKKTVQELTTNTNILSVAITNSNKEIIDSCEKNFTELTEYVGALKNLISQFDENNIASNNAMFANTTDRLALFENQLKIYLDKQGSFISNNNNKLFGEINNTAQLSTELIHKVDTINDEILNSHAEVEELTKIVNDILALDFIGEIKSLHSYLVNNTEQFRNLINVTQNNINDKLANEIYSKYELIISKLETSEDSIKQTQLSSLTNINVILDKISASVLDVLSYVSVKDTSLTELVDEKLNKIVQSLDNTRLNYVENVRDIVETVKIKIENIINLLNDKYEQSHNNLDININNTKEDIKNDLKIVVNKIEELNEYNNNNTNTLSNDLKILKNYIESVSASVNDTKNTILEHQNKIKDELIEQLHNEQNNLNNSIDIISNKIIDNEKIIQDSVKETYEKLINYQNNINNIQLSLDTSSKEFNTNILELNKTTDILKNSFETEINNFKQSLFDNINEAKKELVYTNNDNIGEVKFTVDNMSRTIINSNQDISDKIKNNIQEITSTINTNLENLSELLNEINKDSQNSSTELQTFIDIKGGIIKNRLEDILKSLEYNSTNLKNYIANLKNDSLIEISKNFTSLEAILNETKNKISDLDSIVDEDLTRQLSLIENSFTSISNNITFFIENKFDTISQSVNEEIANVSSRFDELLLTNFEESKVLLSDFIEKTIAKNNDSINSIINRLNSLEVFYSEKIDKQKEILSNISNQISTDIRNYFENADDNYNNHKAEITANIEMYSQELSEINTDFYNKINLDITDINNNLKQHLTELDSSINSIIKTELPDIKTTLTNNVDELLKLIETKNQAYYDGYIKFLENKTNLIVNNFEEKFYNLTTKNTEESSKYLHLVIDNKNATEETLNLKLEKFEAILDEALAQNKISCDEYKNLLSDESLLISTKIEHILNILQEKNENLYQSCVDIFNKNSSDIDDFENSIVNKFTQINDIIQNAINENQTASDELKGVLDSTSSEITRKIEELFNKYYENNTNKYEQLVVNLNNQNNNLNGKIDTIFNNFETDIAQKFENNYQAYSLVINDKFNEIKNAINSNNTEDIDQKALMQINKLLECIENFSNNVDEQFAIFDSDIITIENHTQEINNKITDIKNLIDNTLNTLQSELDANINVLFEQQNNKISETLISNQVLFENFTKNLENTKTLADTSKDILISELRNEFLAVFNNIKENNNELFEKINEQFSLMKDNQKEEINNVLLTIENLFYDKITENIDDLRAEIITKTDIYTVNEQLNNFKETLKHDTDLVLDNINKMLEASVFESTMLDIKKTNEILLETLSNDINHSINKYFQEQFNQELDQKFSIFNNNFTESISEKFEIIKLSVIKNEEVIKRLDENSSLLFNSYASEQDNLYSKVLEKFDDLQNQLDSFNINFADFKDGILSTINGNIDINKIDNFDVSFTELKNEILNTINNNIDKNQISEIENIVKEQFANITQINELCEKNLPQINEFASEVKNYIQDNVDYLADKVKNNSNITLDLENFKSDIITQFVNIFNQISFITEQEEILNFIQEKHSDLITILSHVVTKIDDITEIKDNVTSVDYKVDNLKDDIESINQKINSIISSNNNVDYVYTLQDMEDDISNLRITLNEIKKSKSTEELNDLITSINNIYKLLETISQSVSDFEFNKFRSDFSALSDDIVSISTRTNKLILSSDESYKALQDNLQNFKLVINDLDERTRNFAQEAGLDIIDKKLNSISNIVAQGSRTNKVFNQVFEYLADWVDNAGQQIFAISNKINSLDDLGQIKIMLEDLKANTSDHSDSVEMIEALSNIFDKQAKKIASLEAKLDRIIVDNTINQKNDKIDFSPFEKTMNSFLVALDEKFSSQQIKINSLEEKLEQVVEILNSKDSTQLSKKVGGMDKQIAKLNKSIEKIASHVVDK